MSASEMSSPAASIAGTPSPEPTTPPTSPAKSTKSSPPASPKKAANAAKKEEAKKAKEVAKEMEKAKKWRATQRGKIEKTIEKNMPKVKAQLEKLSTAWDLLGLASYQMRLLDEEEVSNGPELEQKTKEYEEGSQMIQDFIGWIKGEYDPADIVIDEEKSAGDDGEKMEVDEQANDEIPTENGDAASEKTTGAKEQADDGEEQDDDDEDDDE